jgi:hypothetical protein
MSGSLCSQMQSPVVMSCQLSRRRNKMPSRKPSRVYLQASTCSTKSTHQYSTYDDQDMHLVIYKRAPLCVTLQRQHASTCLCYYRLDALPSLFCKSHCYSCRFLFPMAPRSPAPRPARTRTPRTSLNERILAARTEPTIGKSKTRAPPGRSTTAKK